MKTAILKKVGLCFFCLIGLQHFVLADENTDSIESLKKQIQLLTEKVQILEKKVAEREAQTNAPVLVSSNAPVLTAVSTNQDGFAKQLKSLPTVTLGANGLVVQSADSNFLAYVHGYMQMNGRFYPTDSQSGNDTFLLRRVRPIFEGTVYKDYDYRLMLDFGSGNAVPGSSAQNNALLDDAYMNIKFFKPAQLQVGKYKSPVGLERLESTADLMFIETGYATQLTPNYDLGIQLHNALFNTPINYAIGIFNGAADGGSDDQDVNDEGKDVVGRLFFQPFLKSKNDALKKLGFGVAGSFGDRRGSPVSYKTAGQQTLFAYGKDINAEGQQYRIDPQFYYFVGPFGVKGEFVLSSQRLRSTNAAVRSIRANNRAWQIEASYFLTGEENTFKPTSLIRVTPLNPFSLGGGGWGAFEIATRGQQMFLDEDAFPNYAAAGSAKEASSWGVGGNWYLNRNVKLSLDYEWTFFGGVSPAAQSVTSDDEHFITFQAQIAF